MRLFTILLISLYANLLMADAKMYDIFKFKIGDDVYYTTFRFDEGFINKDDLCYYKYPNEYVIDADMYLINELLKLLENGIPLVFCKDLEVISTSKLANNKSFFSDLLMLVNEVDFTQFELIPQLELIDVIRDINSYTTCTPNLNKNDNDWIEEYPTVYLFGIEGDFCNFEFYGIKGNHTKKSLQWLKNRLKKIFFKNEEAFYEELDVLHKQNVIMIGYCGC